MTKTGLGQTVCVTGAGGFIGSWIVKLLLERGYTVRGTVRNTDDPKNLFLRRFDGARERLTLHKADIFDYHSLFDVISGCDGVFHTAFPMTNNEEEVVVKGAVDGTKHVIMAAAAAKVRRLVFTSSAGTLHMDPKRHPDAVIDETYWSDLDYCKNTKNWYCYGKTLAEKLAWEMAKEKGVDMVSVIPVVVIGPHFQPQLNFSIYHIQQFMDGSAKTYPDAVQAYVHVKDTALAHILVFETPSASGRYICVESVLHRRELVAMLAQLFPEYPTPTKGKDDHRVRGKPFRISNKKTRELGVEFTPMKQCLYDTVLSLQENGRLPVLPKQQDRCNARLLSAL